jgi:hypothetical protein
MVLESSVQRMLLLKLNLTIAKELLAPSSYGVSDKIRKNQAKVILRASRTSYSGMSYKRNRTLLKYSDSGGSSEIQELVEVTEGVLSVGD